MSKQNELSPQARARYEQYLANGADKRLAWLESMAYVLASIVNEYIEEANDIMDKYGLKRGKLKTKCNNLTQTFETYHKEMAAMLKDDQEAKEQLCSVYEILKRELDKMMSVAQEEAEK